MKKQLFPWEDRERLGFLPAFGESLRSLILSPSASFQRINPDGPFWPPLLFGGLCLGIGSIASQVWSFAAGTLLGPVFDERARAWLAEILGVNIPDADFRSQLSLTLRLLGGIVSTPIVVPLFLLAATCVYHVVLILIRAPRKTFETTFTAVCYGLGGAGILLVIPFLGGLLWWILGLVYTGIGFSKLHGTTGGQAVLVILIPLLVCCCLFGVLVFSFGGFVALVAAMAAKNQ